MYTFSSRIRYSETDENARLSLIGLMNYFQDCSLFQSTDVGVTLDFLRERQKVWILSSWQVVISRLPEMGEQVRIGTVPYEIRGYLGFRNFVMMSENGEQLAIANSVWLMVDTSTGLPSRVGEDMVRQYQCGQKLAMNYSDRKIRISGELLGTAEPIPVLRHMLDTNDHLNNVHYVGAAMDCLPENFTYSQMRAEYKRSARIGDVLCPKIYDVPEGGRAVVLTDENDSIYAIVEFRV